MPFAKPYFIKLLLQTQWSIALCSLQRGKPNLVWQGAEGPDGLQSDRTIKCHISPPHFTSTSSCSTLAATHAGSHGPTFSAARVQLTTPECGKAQRAPLGCKHQTPLLQVTIQPKWYPSGRVARRTINWSVLTEASTATLGNRRIRRKRR